MASTFARRLLAARAPLARKSTLPPRVFFRYTSHSASSSTKQPTADELRTAVEDLFDHQPPPEAIEPEEPVFTLTPGELEKYKSLLPDHLTADTYSDFRKTSAHKQTVALIRSRGATDEDVLGFEYLILDPDMNGGYINPPRIKRSERDPYGDWWDKQERRNYGEPVHEDNDMLGILSLENYDVFTPKQVFAGWGFFIGGIATLSGIVYLFYPDKPAVRRTAPGGLVEEYGGPRSLSAPPDEE